MDRFIYEIEENYTYNKPTVYKIKFKRLRWFFGYTWYSYQSYEKKYISVNNLSCSSEDAFSSDSKEGIDAFLLWVKKIDGVS